MMDGIKSIMLDKTTAELVQQVDSVLQDCPSGAPSAEVAYMEDALARIHSVDYGFLDVAGSNRADVPAEVFSDVEMFQAYRSTDPSTPAGPEHTVFGALDRTRLAGSGRYLADLLRRPLASAAELQARQHALRKLDGLVDAQRSRVEELLRILRRNERHVLWIYRPMDDELAAVHEIAFFRTFFTSRMNSSGACLTALNLYRIIGSPLIGLLSPVVYFLVPFFILRTRFRVRIPFKTYVGILWRSCLGGAGAAIGGGVGGGLRGLGGGSGSSGWFRYVSMAFSLVFYFQGLFTSFEISSTLRKICGVLVGKMKMVGAFFAAARELLQITWEPQTIVAPWFSANTHAAAPITAPTTMPIWGPDGAASDKGEEGTFSILSNFGEHLRAFRDFDRRVHGAVVNRVYAVDALMSVLRLYSGSGAHNSMSTTASPQADRKSTTDLFCAASFVAKKPSPGYPALRADGVWHPCLDPARVARNSLEVGGRSPPGFLLTGPNAGGKSTLLKAALLAALLAQSLTIAPCSVLELTPFTYINSHMNVPDCKGSSSLFEAEMKRAKSNIDAIRRVASEAGRRGGQGSCLLVMDEIFSSTNPVEGIAGAYSVAKNLVQGGDSLCMVSTHFAYLSKLAKRTGLYANWQMPVSIARAPCGRTRIDYLYRLQPGVSRQYIAIELLKLNDFDEAVVDDAMRVKGEMLNALRPPPPRAATDKKKRDEDGTVGSNNKDTDVKINNKPCRVKGKTVAQDQAALPSSGESGESSSTAD
jgi:MutS domain V